jgi:NADP-dependent 3-hydroxy acid dehydrogenase YdfG
VLNYQVDLTRDGDIQDLTTALLRECRDIDLLIHCAGVLVTGQIESTPVESFDWQYRTNVRAPYFLTQALLPMLRARQGQIVFLNSSVSGRANIGQYAATKHALKALADSLREEVNTAGVRVLSVYPGRTAGSMQAALHAIEGKVYCPERLMQPEDVAQMVIHALGLPRSAEVTDIHLRPMTKPL